MNSKDKGSNFERDATKILTEKIKKSLWKRIPSSGAIGTNLELPDLCGDITGSIEGFPKRFRVECKVGYGNKNSEVKSMTIKKEWLDKIKAEAQNSYAIPFLFCKFDNVRSGIKYMVIFDVDTLASLLEDYTNMQRELELLYEEKRKLYEQLGRTQDNSSAENKM